MTRMEGLLLLLIMTFLIFAAMFLKEAFYISKKTDRIMEILTIGHDAEGNPVPVINPMEHKRSTNIYKNKRRKLEERKGR